MTTNQKSTARQAADLFDKVQRLRAEKIEAIAEAGRKAEERFNKRIVEAIDGATNEVRKVFEALDDATTTETL